MLVRIFVITLALVAVPVYADKAIDPISFERIWLQNNQRNLIQRFRHYNNVVQKSGDSLYLLGIDAAPDRQIKTSDGIKDALISRMHVHYQSNNHLLLIDWLSAIPQPQEYEGFTYGDLILGKTWHNMVGMDYLTLGLRHSSTPRSTVVDSETVFNYVESASQSHYGLFVHAGLGDYQLGTFVSENEPIQTLILNLPTLKLGHHSLQPELRFSSENTRIGLEERYELGVEHRFEGKAHRVKTGVTLTSVPDLDETLISNAFASFVWRMTPTLSLIGGGYYYNDIEESEGLKGAKIGLAWSLEDKEEAMRIQVNIQKNAFGDFSALIIRDEPILVFTLSSRLEGIF